MNDDVTETDLSENNLFNMDENQEKDSNELRLIDVMSKHKKLFIDGELCKNNIVEFINNSFHASYDISNFLNDFNECTHKEQDNIVERENIYNKLLKQLNNEKCDISKCQSIARNGRNRENCKDNKFRISLYGKENITTKEIVYHQIFDSIHVCCLHSFDMGYKLLKSERESIFENKYSDIDENIDAKIMTNLSRLITNKINTFRNQRRKFGDDDVMDEENNKFITVIPQQNISNTDNTCFRELLLNELKANKTNENKLIEFKKYLDDEEYDTDAINIDVGDVDTLNIQTRINNDGCFRFIQSYFTKNNPTLPYYSVGYRYFYWQFYKENDNEQNMIYSSSNKIGSRIKKRSWYDPGNKGYKCSEWYINEKYKNLKTEMLDNDIFRISLYQFVNTVSKSEIKFKSSVSKKKKANVYWQNVYEIPPHSPLTLNHIIALLLYCNYTKLCTAFSATYRKLNFYESNDCLKRRHSNFYHWGKLLRELIEVYGVSFAFTKEHTFYHGISREMYFKNCYTRICGPMSTTTVINVASVKFAGEQGIILKLNNDKSLTFFIDCYPYSDFADEMEKFFIGGFSPIPFESIIKQKTGQNYKLFVTIIATLNKMLVGDKNLNKVTQKHVYAVTKLMQKQINNNEQESDDINVDQYAFDLFKYFCINMEYLKFNMKYMVEDERKSISRKKHVKVYGYKPLYNIFFNDELDMIYLSKILKLFVNVKEIIIEKWRATKYDNDETEKDLSDKLMQFILNSLKTTKSYSFKKLTISMLTPMVEINDVCPASHELKSFITDKNTYSCDKCGDKPTRNTEMYVCFNQEKHCNYSLCKLCYKSKNKSVPKLTKSINHFQSEFNQILWDVNIIYDYKNKSQRISHAICFSHKS